MTNPKNPYAMINKKILAHPQLSWEAKGYYAGYAAKIIEFEEIPENVKKEILIYVEFKEGV